MKKISLQWRITILTSLLIVLSCIAMNLALYYRGVTYMESIGGFITNYSDLTKPDESSENSLYICIPEDKIKDFTEDISNEIDTSKSAFSLSGWIITLVISLTSGVIAYFVTGRSLKPLKDFSGEIERIEMENLTSSYVNEDQVKEFKNLSQSFNELLKRLSSSFEEQGQFTANAAHELRTPLALMQAKIDYFKSDSSKDLSLARETMDQIENQIERLKDVTKILLDISELDSVKRNDRIDLYPLVEEIIQDLTPLAESKKIDLEISGTNIAIKGNDTLIYRAIFNILENAIKYNREGGKVSINISVAKGRAKILFTDTGIGIEKDDWGKIFNPFYRADKSRNGKVSGTGLGLALVSKIVSLHRGQIKIIDSRAGKTVISLDLPKIK
ncbi:sensor histidine kinase [Peptoniphilus raoultii]|uniref:sensor histidine kinase n=1 Tax=Peptoniphilus raoultii TaxID=1776387 RepID=UPI0008D99868|nr:HAMP domain-containing sensor histidine kinase [Peptoniphilus raoultii]